MKDDPRLHRLLVLTAVVLGSIGVAPVRAAGPDNRVYELRTYYAAYGKLDDLDARFRDHTLELLAKHGMTNIGYWVPIDNPESQSVYVLAYPCREARPAKSWSFVADPEWQKAQSETEAKGRSGRPRRVGASSPTDRLAGHQASSGPAPGCSRPICTASRNNLDAANAVSRAHA